MLELTSNYEFPDDPDVFAIDANERYIALSVNSDEVRVLDRNGAFLWAIQKPNPDGILIAAAVYEDAVLAGASDRIRLWDIATGGCLRVVHPMPAPAAAFATCSTPERPLVVAGDCDGNIAVFCARSGAALTTLGGHDDEITALAVTPSLRCVSAYTDSTVRVWDLATGKCLYVLRSHARQARHPLLDGGGRRAITSGLDGPVWVWDLETGVFTLPILATLATLPGHAPKPTNNLRMYQSSHAADGGGEEQLVTAGVDGYVRLWSLTTYEQLRAVRVHEKAVLTMDVLDGVVLTGGKEGGETDNVCGLFNPAVTVTFPARGALDGQDRSGERLEKRESSSGKPLETTEQNEAEVKQLGSLAEMVCSIRKLGDRVAVVAIKRGKLLVEIWKPPKQDEKEITAS